jgi:hypothetical protein
MAHIGGIWAGYAAPSRRRWLVSKASAARGAPLLWQGASFGTRAVQVLHVKDRRSSLSPGALGPSGMSEQDVEDFPDPDEWLKGEARYVASLQRVLSLSKDFQRSLKPVQQKLWLELEEALLDHSRLLQEACYAAGKQRGATEGEAHWSQELVKTVAAALRHRSGEAELVELLIKAIEQHMRHKP